MSNINDCVVLELQRITDRAGNITPVQSELNVPFNIKRVFYLYDIPAGESRGAHAHKNCHQFIVAASGSFEVMLEDGVNKKMVQLNRPFIGLYVPPMVWACEVNFSSGAICLVLTSELYDPNDYIRDYNEFLKYKLK